MNELEVCVFCRANLCVECVARFRPALCEHICLWIFEEPQ